MAETSKDHGHYMPTLDGVRGLACLIVVMAHIEVVLRLNAYDDVARIGSFGVLMFFSLSGFLMGMLYMGKPCNYDGATKYIVSRVSRIAPAYYIAVIFCWILYMNIPDFHYKLDPPMLARSFMFISSQGVFWSIPPEIQFYGFFLLLWVSFDQAVKGKYIPALVVGAIVLACIATRSMWGGLLLPSKIHIFLFGVMASFAVKNGQVRKIICSPVAQFLIFAATFAYFQAFIEFKTIYTDVLFAAMVATCVASLSSTTILTAPLKTEMMRMIGNASFSIYLIHDFLLHAMDGYILVPQNPLYLNIGIACVVSLTIPVAFHFMVEKRLNEWAKVKGNEWAQKIKGRFISKRAA